MQNVAAEDFNLPGLSGTVTVFEDQYGIPSISGDNPLDVALVQGYLHARDRFFQMEYNRKAAAGRLAEIVGEPALSSDVQFRLLGLGRAALKTWQALDGEVKGWLQAYANGVNLYLANNPLPPEHTAVELTRTDPWTPLDTILIGKLIAASFSLDPTSEAEATIALGTYVGVGQVVGFDGEALFFEDTHRSAPPDDRVTDPTFLAPPGQSATEAATGSAKEKPKIEMIGSRSVSDTTLKLAIEYKQAVDNAPIFKSMLQNQNDPNGSNAWIVGGEHTESGFPMIANDPHLTMDTPSIWYENHLNYQKDGEAWNVNGTTLAGAPGVVLGCSSHACWGMTVNPLDVTDTFTEAFLTNALGLPTHTIYKGTPEPINQEINSYFVNVIGDGIPDNIVKAPIGYLNGFLSLSVPRRNDGPIIAFGEDGKSGLSYMYTGFRDTYEFTAFRGMNDAGSMEEFLEALQYFDIAIQNVYYADVEGNIAWQTTSEKPLREDLANFTIDGLPPWFIRDGTGAAANEWLPVMNPQPNQALDYEILPASEMPHMINPEKGFVTNANNDPVGVTLDNVPFNQVRPNGAGLYYLNSHYVAYRMGRVDREIKAAIDAADPVTVADFEDLQANVELLDAELVLPTLLAIMSQVPLSPESPMAQALDVLSTWDYSAHTGIAEGYDAGDDPDMATEPDMTEIRHSAAATVWAMWRSMLVKNTIDANLIARGLGDYLPPSGLAYNGFKHLLLNYPTNGGIGASGIDFFPNGLAETVAGSLQLALDRLASDEFAPAFANSTDVLDYRWGKLHRIVFNHPLNVDPFNVPNGGSQGFTDLAPGLRGLSRQGGYEAVDASSHSARADTLNGYMFGSGPSRRFIGVMDPMGTDAKQVIPGGQSGLFYHPNYDSQLPLWLVNDYHPMALSAQDAVDAAIMTYTFGPAQ